MVTRTDQLLRKAMRGYLEYLDNMPLAERIKNSAAFDDVYHFLLNGSGRLELRRADVAAVRVFLRLLYWITVTELDVCALWFIVRPMQRKVVIMWEICADSHEVAC